MRLPDDILTEAAFKAAAHYVSTTLVNAPIDMKQHGAQSCADGFWMGVRWLEERLQNESDANRALAEEDRNRSGGVLDGSSKVDGAKDVDSPEGSP